MFSILQLIFKSCLPSFPCPKATEYSVLTYLCNGLKASTEIIIFVVVVVVIITIIFFFGGYNRVTTGFLWLCVCVWLYI